MGALHWLGAHMLIGGFYVGWVLCVFLEALLEIFSKLKPDLGPSLADAEFDR